jgi:glycosyltransferase 2 family protein
MFILALRWLVPVAVLAVFVVTGHLGEAISALSGVSLAWSLPLVVVGTALPISHAWRWRYLLQRAGSDIGLAAASRVTSLASLVNYAAPGFLGAPAKAVLARDSNRVPISRSLPTLAIEQFLDALLLAVAGVIAVLLAGPLLFTQIGSDTLVEGVYVIAATAGTIVVVGSILWFLAKRFHPAFVVAVKKASVALLYSTEHRGQIAFLTCIRWVLDMAAVALASVAIGLRLGIVDILLIANLSLLAGLIAPVPGGLGVREAVMASLAGVLGISIPVILALAVLHRAGLAVGLPLVLAGSRLFEWSRR